MMMAKRWTFQTLIDARMTVTAYCHKPKCHHSQSLNLRRLKDKFGPDAPAMEWDLRAKLSCKERGNTDAKLFGLIYAPTTTSTSLSCPAHTSGESATVESRFQRADWCQVKLRAGAM